MKGLTVKQQDILDFIYEFMGRENMAPTIFEISEHFNIKAATAFMHVRSLQRKGYVTRSSKARSLALTQSDKPRHCSLTMSIPVLGRISAGAPSLSEQNIERTIRVDSRCLPKGLSGQKLFALQVHGESMRDLGILDGDLIFAKQTREAAIGDIVVAMVEGENTVKSLYLSNEQWELRPANPDFKPIRIPLDKLSIQGVVVALQRTY